MYLEQKKKIKLKNKTNNFFYNYIMCMVLFGYLPYPALCIGNFTTLMRSLTKRSGHNTKRKVYLLL